MIKDGFQEGIEQGIEQGIEAMQICINLLNKVSISTSSKKLPTYRKIKYETNP